MLYKVGCVLLALVIITLGIFCGLNATQLNDANLTIASLNSRVINLNDQISSLQTSVSELTTKRDNLSAQLATANGQNSSLTSQLADINTKLSAANSQLADARSQLSTKQSELLATQAQLSASNATAANLQAQLSASNAMAANLQAQLTNMQSGYGYVVNDSTYSAVKAFLASDPTDGNVYKDYSYGINAYTCVNFSADVVKNAAIQHIRCGYVLVDFFQGLVGHAIVVFNTTDKGLVFIEPQEDFEVNLMVGTHYWQTVIIPSGQHYLPPAYDDTVLRYFIVW